MEGFVAALLRKEGDKDIKLGEPLFILVEDEKDVAKFADFTIDKIGAAPAVPPPAAATPVATPQGKILKKNLIFKVLVFFERFFETRLLGSLFQISNSRPFRCACGCRPCCCSSYC